MRTSLNRGHTDRVQLEGTITMDPVTATQSADSIGQLIAGGGIALSGAVVLKLIEVGSRMWAARSQKNEIGPQPFEVKETPEYTLKGDCIGKHAENERQHENIFARLTWLEKEATGVKANVDTIKGDVGDMKQQVDRLVWNLIPGSRHGKDEKGNTL